MAAPKRREDPSLDAYRAGQAAAAKYRDRVTTTPVQPAAAPSTPTVPAEAPSETDLAAAEQQSGGGGGIMGALGSFLKPAETYLSIFGKDLVPGSHKLSVDDALDLGLKYTTRPAIGFLAKNFADDLAKLPGSDWSPEELDYIAQATSSTDAYNRVWELRKQKYNPTVESGGQFLAEGTLDPLNLVGAVGKTAKVGATGAGLIDDAGRGARLAKGLDDVSRGEDLLNAAMGLPITAPFQAAGFAGRNTIGRGISKIRGEEARPLLGQSKGAEVRTSVRGANEALDFAFQRGGTTETVRNVVGNISQFTSNDILNTLQTIPNRVDQNRFLSTLPDADIGRAWAQTQTDPTMAPFHDLLTSHLERDGLVVRGRSGVAPTQRLNAHLFLDQALDQQQVATTNREVSHAFLDAAALGSFKTNRRMFRTLDDAYGDLAAEMTFNPDDVAGGLHQKWILAATDGKLLDKLDMAAPTESIDRLFTATAGLTPEAEKWYFHGAEFLYHAGFDYSPALSDDAVERIFNTPQFQESIAEYQIDPAVAKERLHGLTKIDAILALIGAGSQNSGPKENLAVALRAYKDLIQGNDISGSIQLASARVPNAYRRLVDDEAFLSTDYIRESRGIPKPGAKKAATTEDRYPGSGTISGVPDKMHDYSMNFRKEFEAVTAYYAALEDGLDETAARQVMDQARQSFDAFTNDRWNKRAVLDTRQWIDPEQIRSGKLPSISSQTKQATFNQFGDKQADWQAVKTLGYDRYYPHLTGKPIQSTGLKPETQSLLADEWAKRMPNTGAFQARLWGLVNLQTNVGTEVIKELQADPQLLSQIQAMGDDQMRDWFSNEVITRIEKYVADGTIEPYLRPNDNLASLMRPGETYGQYPDPRDTFKPDGSALKKFGPKRPLQNDFADIRPSLDGETFTLPDGRQIPRVRQNGNLAIDQILTGDFQHLLQGTQDRVRGAFIKGRGGDPSKILLTPNADPTTLPHELAHLVRQTLGPEDQRLLAESFGRDFGPGTSDVEAEEWFADAFENLLRTGDISTLPPALQEAVMKWRQISQLVYKRQAPTSQMDNQLGQMLLDRLSGIAPRFRTSSSADRLRRRPRAGREVGGSTGTAVPSPATVDAIDSTTPDLIPTTPLAPVGSTDLRRSGFRRRRRRTMDEVLPDPADRSAVGVPDPVDDITIQPEGYVDPDAYRPGVNTPEGPRQPNPIDPEYADVPWDDPDLQTLLNNPNFQKIQEAADDSIRRTMRNEAVDDRTILQTGKMTRREVAETMSDQDLETMVVDILDLMDKGIYPQTDGIAATMEVIGEIYNRRFRNVTQDAAASVEPAVARDLAKSPGRVTPSAIFPANDTIDEAVQAERQRRGLGLLDEAAEAVPVDVESTLSELRTAMADVRRKGRQSASALSDFQVEDYANRLKQAMDEGWIPEDADEQTLQLLQREYEGRFDQPLFQNTPGTSAAGNRVRPTTRRVANAAEARQVIQRGEYVTLSAWRTGVDEATNQANTARLEQLIRDAGYEPYRTEGVYEGFNEPSFFIPGMTREDAVKLGNQYNQDSILNGTEGLVYMADGSVNRRQGPVQFQTNPTDNFSRVHLPDGSTVSFTQNMDWSEQITPDTQINVDDGVFMDTSRPGDTITDVLSTYAAQHNLPIENAEKVAAVFEPVTTLNPEHFAAQELIDNEAVLRHLEAGLQSGDEAAIRQGVERALTEMNQKWEAFGIRHPAANRFIKKVIKSTPQGRSQQRSTLAGRSRNASTLIDEKAERIREVFQTDEVQAFEKQYETDKQGVEDAIFEIRNADPRAQALPEITDLTTMGDIRKYADFTQNADLKKTVNDFFKQYDLDTTVREAYKGEVLTAYQKSLEKKLGIPQKPHKAYERVWNNVTSAWREQALLSPKNTGLNVMDMAFKSVVHGVNFMVPRNAAQMQAQRWGHEIPITARTDAGHFVGSNREEFARQGQRSALGKILPGVAGDGADKVVNWKRGVDRMFEDVFRTSAWRSRTQQHLEQAALPRFRGEIRRASKEYGGNTDQILSDLKTFGDHSVDFNADDVYQIATAAGMNERGARNLSTRWGHYIQEASDQGVEFSNKVHFDIYDERYLEELLHVRSWAPFHFFMTRNIPYYLETMAAHPALFRIWRDYENLSAEEQERLGLTARFNDTIPMDIPLAGGILDVLLGPGTAYANPMVAMSIADQFRPQYTEDDATLVGKIADAGTPLGLSPAPWISVPLQAFGAYGPNAEAPNLLRHSRLVKATTGFDPESLPKRGVQWLQSKATGKSLETVTGSAIKDYNVNKRIAELSIERTGRANHPEFVAAFDSPDNPIWQMALADVNRQERFDAIYGFVSPVPMKYLPDTEALIRSQRQELPDQLTGDPRKAVVASGVPAGGYLKVPYKEAESSAERNRRSGSGSSQSSQTSTAWGGEIWGPGKGGFFGNPRAYSLYQQWRGRMPDGADTSPNAFLTYIQTTYPVN